VAHEITSQFVIVRLIRRRTSKPRGPADSRDDQHFGTQLKCKFKSLIVAPGSRIFQCLELLHDLRNRSRTGGDCSANKKRNFRLFDGCFPESLAILSRVDAIKATGWADPDKCLARGNFLQSGLTIFQEAAPLKT